MTALDALLVINAIANRTTEEVDPATEVPSANLVDVNGDYRITALDALEVINEIARRNAEREASFRGGNSVALQQSFPPQSLASVARENAASDDDDNDNDESARFIDAAIQGMF